MSKKCRAYSESRLGLEPSDNQKAFYAGWDAALREALAHAPEVREPPAQPQQEPVITKNEKGLTLHVGWDDLPAGTKLYTSPPASKPHGFAGVTAWIGDATVTQIVTQVRIQREREAGQAITQAAQTCLDMLAAHGIKGDA